MQDQLFILSFIVLLPFAFSIKELVNKERSTLPDQEMPVITGIGTWKARFMSNNNGPENAWHKSPEKKFTTQRKFGNYLIKDITFIVGGSNESKHGRKELVNKDWSTFLDPEISVKAGIGTWEARFMSDNNGPENTWYKSPDKKFNTERKLGNDLIKNITFTDSGSNANKYDNTEHTHFKDTQDNTEKENGLNETIYTNRTRDEVEADSSPVTYFPQPAWQLPVSKLNESDKSENLTVLSLSSLHKFWESTNQIRRFDEFDNTNLELESETLNDINQHVNPTTDCEGECLNQDNLGEMQYGDLDSGESRGHPGGEQQILLIKDDNSGGGTSSSSTSGKNNIGPVMMMLTPLIMMSVMMPMMMSVMAGMLNFMKGMTGMMMMLTWPKNGAALQQVTKHRKSDGDEKMRTDEFLNSFIQELSEKLELAINKYHI